MGRLTGKPTRRQVAFRHIGKTAGSSVHFMMRDAFPAAKVMHRDGVGFMRATREEIAAHDLVLGHFPFDVVQKLRPDRFLFTFIRDPVERVLSAYYYLRAWDGVIDAGNHVTVPAAKSLSLDAFIASDNPIIRSRVRNAQARAFCPMDTPDEQIADTAMANLRAFDFIGIAERFDDSMTELCRRLRVTTPQTRREKASNRPRDIDPHLMAKIREMNEIDSALYERAREQRWFRSSPRCDPGRR